MSTPWRRAIVIVVGFCGTLLIAIEISGSIDDSMSLLNKVIFVLSNPYSALLVGLVVFVFVVGWPEAVANVAKHFTTHKSPQGATLAIDDGLVAINPDKSVTVSFVVTNVGPGRVRQIRLQVTDLQPLTNREQANYYAHKCKSRRVEHADNDGTRDSGGDKRFIVASTDSAGDWMKWLWIHCMNKTDVVDRVQIPEAEYALTLTATGQNAMAATKKVILSFSNRTVAIKEILKEQPTSPPPS